MLSPPMKTEKILENDQGMKTSSQPSFPFLFSSASRRRTSSLSPSFHERFLTFLL